MGAHLSAPEDFDLVQFLESRSVVTKTNAHFARWDIPNVRAAWQRVFDVKRAGTWVDAEKRGVVDYLITEAEFREAFQELSVIHNGAFLSLPLSVFADFATKSSDQMPGQQATVFLPNLMSTLILFCEGTFQAKMAFLFDMADLNRAGEITLTELMFLLITCTRMMHKLGLCCGAPSQNEVLELSQECFDKFGAIPGSRITGIQFDLWVRGSKKLTGLIRQHIVVDLSSPVVVQRRITKKVGAAKNELFKELISSPAMEQARTFSFRTFTDKMQTRSTSEFKVLQSSADYIKGSTPLLRSKTLAQAKLGRILGKSHDLDAVNTKGKDMFKVKQSLGKTTMTNFAANALSKLNLGFASIESSEEKKVQSLSPEKKVRKESRLKAMEKLSKLSAIAAPRAASPGPEGGAASGARGGSPKKSKAGVRIQLRQLHPPALAALEEFRDSTGWAEQKWRNITGWDSILHADEVFGTEFEEDPSSPASCGQQVLVVVKLAMRQNNLTGPIPLGISALNTLQEIKLKENQLTGLIPWASLAQLTALSDLDLSANGFDAAPIDAAIGSMQSLKRLAIASANVTGGLPQEMQQLKALEMLDLGNNQLEGPLPEWIGQLTDLTELFLQQNSFSGPLPAAIGRLERLNALRLNHNELSGKLPVELGDLVDLEELHLHRNQLESVPDGIFREMSALEELKLESNCLKGFPTFVLLLSEASEECECSIGDNQWELSADSGERISSRTAVEMEGVVASELWGALKVARR
jgi:hypothetical protein